MPRATSTNMTGSRAGYRSSYETACIQFRSSPKRKKSNRSYCKSSRSTSIRPVIPFRAALLSSGSLVEPTDSILMDSVSGRFFGALRRASHKQKNPRINEENLLRSASACMMPKGLQSIRCQMHCSKDLLVWKGTPERGPQEEISGFWTKWFAKPRVSLPYGGACTDPEGKPTAVGGEVQGSGFLRALCTSSALSAVSFVYVRRTGYQVPPTQPRSRCMNQNKR